MRSWQEAKGSRVADWREVADRAVFVEPLRTGYACRTIPVVDASFAGERGPTGIPAGHFVGKVLRANRCGTDKEILQHHGARGLSFVPGHEVAVEVLDVGPRSALRAGQRGAVRVRNQCGCKFCAHGQTHFCQGPFDESNPLSVERGIAPKAANPTLGFGGFRELVCYPDDALSVDAKGRVRPKDLALAEPSAIGYNALLLAHTEGAQIPYWLQADDQGRRPVVVVLGIGPCAAVTGLEVLTWADILTARFRQAHAARLDALWKDVQAVIEIPASDSAAWASVRRRWERTLAALDPTAATRGTAGWFPTAPFSAPGRVQVVFISRTEFDPDDEGGWDSRWRTIRRFGGADVHYVPLSRIPRNRTGIDFASLVSSHPAFGGRFPCATFDFCTSAVIAEQAARSRHLGGFGGADTVCVGTSVTGPERVADLDCGTAFKWDVLRASRKIYAVNFPYVAMDLAVEMLGLVDARIPGYFDAFVQTVFASPDEFASGAEAAHDRKGVFRVALDPDG